VFLHTKAVQQERRTVCGRQSGRTQACDAPGFRTWQQGSPSRARLSNSRKTSAQRLSQPSTGTSRASSMGLNPTSTAVHPGMDMAASICPATYGADNPHVTPNTNDWSYPATASRRSDAPRCGSSSGSSLLTMSASSPPDTRYLKHGAVPGRNRASRRFSCTAHSHAILRFATRVLARGSSEPHSHTACEQ
jgi:hypothetical protein